MFYGDFINKILFFNDFIFKNALILNANNQNE